jgi:hypothetical protein
MACDTITQPTQTKEERAAEVRAALLGLERGLGRRQIRATVGPQGAITFTGWENRAGITDACAYRKIMISGSSLARLEIQRAEQLAGVKVNRQTIAAGTHSHDGGATWGKH